MATSEDGLKDAVFDETRDLTPGLGRPASPMAESPTTEAPPGRPAGQPREGELNPALLRPGDLFAGRFEIESLAGRGGFSFVFRARDRQTGESVALKFLASHEAAGDLVSRMQRELRLSRDLRHPNIVRVYELLQTEGFLCLTMEFVKGPTLKEKLVSESPLPLQEGIRILGSLASAMAAVHAAGVVHRDLKPQNVVVAEGGEVKLLDFGLAKTPESTGLTMTGTILGTPEYMSPEQVEGKVADARSDLYSLGIIGYELLAGQPPFRGDNALATALQHIRSRVPDVRKLRPEAPEALARLLLRMTDRSPEARPPSAQAVLMELTRREQVTMLSPGRPRPRFLPLAAALLLLLAGAGFLAVKGRASARAPGDPFADGIVDVAVVPKPTADVVGVLAFSKTLGDLLSSRLAGPSTRVHSLTPEDARLGADKPTELAKNGIEQLCVVGISRELDSENEGPVYVIGASIRSTADGSLWLKFPEQRFKSLDLDAADSGTQRLAQSYLKAVAERLKR